MKRRYMAELYCQEGERKFVEVEASPAEMERIALELLRDNKYAGVRFLREENRPQVVEVLHYRRQEGGMVRAVWRE